MAPRRSPLAARAHPAYRRTLFRYPSAATRRSPRSAIRQHPILQAEEQVDARGSMRWPGAGIVRVKRTSDWEPRSRGQRRYAPRTMSTSALLSGANGAHHRGGLLRAARARTRGGPHAALPMSSSRSHRCRRLLGHSHPVSRDAHAAEARAAVVRSDLTPFVGSADQMASRSPRTRLPIFWYVVLAAKLSWGYFVLIEPLHPLKALWYSDEHCWRATCGEGMCTAGGGAGRRRRPPPPPQPRRRTTRRGVVLASLWRLLLIFVRCAVLSLSTSSTISSTRSSPRSRRSASPSRAASGVASWAQMLRTEEAVAQFDAVDVEPADDDDGDGDEDDDEEAGLSCNARVAAARERAREAELHAESRSWWSMVKQGGPRSPRCCGRSGNRPPSNVRHWRRCALVRGSLGALGRRPLLRAADHLVTPSSPSFGSAFCRRRQRAHLCSAGVLCCLRC